MLTAEMKSIFKNADKGNRIYFEYIKAIEAIGGRDSIMKMLQPINIEIE